MRGRKPAPVVLAEEVRQALEQFARRPSTPQQLALSIVGRECTIVVGKAAQQIGGNTAQMSFVRPQIVGNRAHRARPLQRLACRGLTPFLAPLGAVALPRYHQRLGVMGQPVQPR